MMATTFTVQAGFTAETVIFVNSDLVESASKKINCCLIKKSYILYLIDFTVAT